MLHFKAQGYYTWVVLNGKDKIVSHAPTYSRNMILTQGLDGIAVRSWADSFVACAIGTGISSPATSQTGLDNEVVRTAVYLDLVDANSTILSGSDYTLRRTFVFPKEGSAITYREAGFSYSTTGPNALFSRVRLPNVAVASGERLIIQYELVITLSPTTTAILVNPIAAIQSTSGSFQYQKVGLKGVNSLGQTYDYDSAAGCNEPSTAAKGFLSANSTGPAAFGSAVDRSGTTFETDISLSAYVPGSYTRNKILTATNKQAINAGWRSVGLGAITNSYVNTGLVHVMNTNFAKSQGLLEVLFKFTWSYVVPPVTGETLFYWNPEENMVLRKQNLLLHYFGLNDE
jgi:hypothetical protein